MNTRRRLQGVVKSNKMEKTVIVEISRTFRHPLYQKVIHTVSKMKAHDEMNCQVGDIVEIIESKPISRTKRWMVEKIISRQEAREELPEETPAAAEG
jgi:small subunit ribosomal protein S17